MEFSMIYGINLWNCHQIPVLARVFDGKMKILQDNELGKIKGSAALTRQNIADILSNSATSISTPDTLIKREEIDFQQSTRNNRWCSIKDAESDFYLQTNPKWKETGI
ncbi:10374_t:CDS:2 [Funneliformis geosporum]|uniref:10374_t:CDS:1 n=1 Tax=Funneliformis geosporum TaxID=1117311 RepID=A0A9W4WQT5_9GLOM|nr:10374_t:CDS:2 [Funneliformis geosporum]